MSVSFRLAESERIVRCAKRPAPDATARAVARGSPERGVRCRVFARQVGADQRHLLCRLRQPHAALVGRPHDDVSDRADVRRATSSRVSSCCRSRRALPIPASANTSAFPTNGPWWRSISNRPMPCRMPCATSAKRHGDPEEAARLGFEVGEGQIELYRGRRRSGRGAALAPRGDQFSAPLLKQGLVILDTPASTPSVPSRN